MAFNSIREIVKSSVDEGSDRFFGLRKLPNQVSSQGIWFDITQSPGNPRPKHWLDATPNKAAAISQSVDGGIWHGGNVAPDQKIIRELMMISSSVTPTPMPIILCDYLLYYPSIDESVTDPQTMDNTVTLPRYTDGEGVQVMAVFLTSRTGGATVTLSYTNQDGTSGRVTSFTENAATAYSTIVNSALTSTTANSNSTGPFIKLQGTDTGVRSIDAVTMDGLGDTGLFSLVLVKPLAYFTIRTGGVPVEVDFLKDFSTTPIVEDDAFLSFICAPNGSLSGVTILGTIKTNFS